MEVEKALKTAIEYEIKVRDAYYDAADKSKDDTGRKIFKVLGDEERGHVDYLNSKLSEWQKTGKALPEKLESVVPSPKAIQEGVQKLNHHLSRSDRGTEKELLSKALQLETETSNFYQRMVDEMGPDGDLFERFLEIEKGHQAIVQAELDYHQQTGYLFDFQDFGMV
jgi:rubrerythrin